MRKKKSEKPKAPAATPTPERIFDRPSLLWMLAIVLLSAAVYANVLDNAFVWDDEAQVVQNTAIQHMGDIWHLFEGSTFASHGSGSLKGQYYKPLMSVGFMFAWAMGDGSPMPFHLMQVVIYTLNAIFVFFFFRRFFPRDLSGGLALFFLVCPLASETARYVANYQDTLYFFFGIIAMNLLIYLENRWKAWVLYPLVALCLLCALLSKETGALFLGVAFLYKAFFNRERFAGFLASLAAAFGIYLYMRIGVAGMTIKHDDFLAPIGRTNLLERLQTIPKIWTYYVVNFVFPYDLGVSKHWVVRDLTWSDFWLPLVVFLGFLASILAMWWTNRTWRTTFFLLWFLAGMGLHSQFFPLDTTAADRWFYFPVVGLMGLLTETAIRYRRPWMTAKPAVALGVAVILAMAVRTAVRNQDWQTGLELFTRDLPYSPDSFELQNNVGTEMFRAGQIEEACPYFERSTELAPHWWTNWNNLGVCKQRAGDYGTALRYFEKALNNGHYYLSYVNIAGLLVGLGKTDEARKFLRERGLVDYPNGPELQKFARDLGMIP